MIEIKNIKEESVSLYDKFENYLGEIESNIQFSDVRNQIKKKNLHGYYIVKKDGTKIDIDNNGYYDIHGTIFNKSHELLVERLKIPNNKIIEQIAK